MDVSASISIAYLVAAFIMVGLILFLPRQYVIIPIIISVCYLNLEQKFIIAGVNIHLLRVFIMFGWIRLISRKEFQLQRLNYIDVVIVCWVAVSILTYTILWLTWEAFVNRVGFAFDALGIYFFLRYIIVDYQDIMRTIFYIAIIVIPLGILMLYESITGENVFILLAGGTTQGLVRYGDLRCQGPFRHPILAGTFGASIVPLIVPLLWQEKSQILALAALCSATAIVITSHSSGAVLAYIAVIISFLLWPLRNHMNIVRWGILISLLSVHLIFKTPVWYVYAKLSDILGGTGWHRSYLIEQAIRYFDEWWFIGAKYTAHWMPYALAAYPTRADITNQYIAEGVDGGLLKLILFVSIIICGFNMLGWKIRAMENTNASVSEKIIPWAIGVSLFAHIMAMFSVTYFDQILVFWYLLFAMIPQLDSTGNVYADK
jgi:hypothetical protein